MLVHTSDVNQSDLAVIRMRTKSRMRLQEIKSFHFYNIDVIIQPDSALGLSLSSNTVLREEGQYLASNFLQRTLPARNNQHNPTRRADTRYSQRKVTGVDELDNRVGEVAVVRLRAGGDEDRVGAAPDGEERRAARAEERVEGGVERDVGRVVELERALRARVARTRHERVVERVRLGRDRARVRRAVGVLREAVPLARCGRQVGGGEGGVEAGGSVPATWSTQSW